MNRIIDRYIFKEWLKTLGIAIMLILGILVLEDMYKNLKNFLERGADFTTLIIYYLHLIPNCLSTVLPISFFISTLYVLNDMQAHNEIVALRASGMTVFQITRCFWLAAILLATFMLGLNAYLLPYASDKMQQIVMQIDFNDQKRKTGTAENIGIQRHLCLHNEKGGRLWYINKFSLYTRNGSFVTLSLINAQKRETERIEASKVYYNSTTKTWGFEEGKHWFFDPDTFTPTHFKPFLKETLQCEETPELMSYIHKPLKHLGINELKNIIHFVPKNHPRFQEHTIKYFSLLSNPLVCFMIVLLAIPFSLRGVRINPIVGVSKASGLFFAYYIIGSIGRILGTQNLLSPILAAWLPNLLMLLLGCILYQQLAPK